MAAALRDRGIPALGIDTDVAAVQLARAAGAVVRRCDVFSHVPGEGGWATALLVDGNIGIGGAPLVLLCRVAALTGPTGLALQVAGADLSLDHGLPARVIVPAAPGVHCTK